MILQTSNAKLRERALQENISYDFLMTLGVAKEQSVKGAAALEKASGNSKQSSKVKIEEEVWKLRQENKQLRSQSSKSCTRCQWSEMWKVPQDEPLCQSL